MSFGDKSKLEEKSLLKNSLIQLLENLNNGDKFTSNDIELSYKQIQPLIDLLYMADDFSLDDYDEEIYCFIKGERKIFDKYHIQDIASVLLEYQEENNHSKFENFSKEIEYILKESKLPRRDDEKYEIISSYAKNGANRTSMLFLFGH